MQFWAWLPSGEAGRRFPQACIELSTARGWVRKRGLLFSFCLIDPTETALLVSLSAWWWLGGNLISFPWGLFRLVPLVKLGGTRWDALSVRICSDCFVAPVRSGTGSSRFRMDTGWRGKIYCTGEASGENTMVSIELKRLEPKSSRLAPAGTAFSRRMRTEILWPRMD